MSKLQGFALTYAESASKIGPDSATPNMVKNIERMAEKYQKFIDSEISEEQASQSEQAEKVKKLKESGLKKKKKAHEQETIQEAD